MTGRYEETATSVADQVGDRVFDVVVVGGGVVGCATAWHLLESAPGISVAVVEPDPSYRLAASSTASGGVRQLFSRPENVQLSQYTHEIIDTWTQWAARYPDAADEVAPDLGWYANGYLFIADPGHATQLRADFDQQRSLGVDNLWLEPEEMSERFPYLSVDDLGPGVLSPHDGWLDPHAFLHGMRARARRLDARYVVDKVLDFDVRDRRIEAVRLESGGRLRGNAFVNVAGVWGPALSERLGLKLPVEPMRRFDHYVETPGDYSAYPFVKDPSGLAVRPEGGGLTAALVDFSHPSGYDLTIDQSYFEDVVWPALAHRFPDTDRLKIVSTWAGLYDQNRLDGNVIIDRWEALDNYCFAAGFSGHGLMHAPAVGRALTELALHGRYETIDLTRMGLARIISGTPYAELAIR
ncbi:FAD-binding oxidoreductase [Streptomyces europaeiscabiei]|uniref:NAD(P)/FAD-dependent oxidoreductase n=1 Tax=Streptomyces europaeiscabiei TaxID=146819 RepID=UPI002E185F60